MRNSGECLEQTRHCLRCCLCQTVCPVFGEIQAEPASPRSKVRLVREALEGYLGWSRRLEELLYLCLNCGRCLEACPARIDIDGLIRLARAELRRHRGLGWDKSLLLRILGGRGKSLALAVRAITVLRKTALVRPLLFAARGKMAVSGLYRLLELTPNAPGSSLRARLGDYLSPYGPKGKIGYFIGCLTDWFYPQVGMAVVEVLEQLGYQVVVPGKLACCGLPHLTHGETEMAYRLARGNVKAFEEAGVEHVVTDCGSCLSFLGRYGRVFGDRAFMPSGGGRGFAAPRVTDISAFLVENGLVGQLNLASAQNITVTYHDPCHLSRSAGVRQEPREVLRSIPGLSFKEMPGSDQCCGAGGLFGIVHPNLSDRILSRKLNGIRLAGAEVVATGCPACRMQIEYGLRVEGIPARTAHPVELLAAYIAREEKVKNIAVTCESSGYG